MKNLLSILLVVIIYSSISAQTVPPYVPVVGLVGWWPFNGNANDESGNGNNGTVNGAVISTDRNGNPNSAYSFDSTQSITGSCLSFPSGNNPRSICFWYNAVSLGVLYSQQILGYGGDACGHSYIMIFENHDIGSPENIGKYEVQGSCLAFRTYTNYPAPANNVWHQIALTYDGSVLKFYNDGILVLTSSSITIDTHIQKDGIFCIGTTPAGNEPYFSPDYPGFKGKLDDIGIWNRSLTQQEVTQLYKSCVSTPAASITANGNLTVCKPSTVMLAATPTGNGETYKWKKGTLTIASATTSVYAATQTGTYKCVVTNACGSATSNSVTVTVNPQPTASINPPNGLDLCGQDSVLLQANSGSGYTYKWMKGASPISGATNSSYAATMKGTYKVVVTNSFGCNKTSAGAKVVKTCKESDAIGQNADAMFSCYPNPSQGKFMIMLNAQGIENTEADIGVISIIGKTIYEEDALTENGNLQKEISLPDEMPDGIYLVQVKTGGKTFQSKLIYEK